MTEEMQRIYQIRNNWEFTQEDILFLLKQDYDLDDKLLNLRAHEIFCIIHSNYRHELYVNSKENEHKKDFDVELIGMIENQKLIEIENDLKTILTPEQHQIFEMIRKQCNREFIEGWFNISNATFYKQKHAIYNAIFQTLCYR
jgi:hypothetical protein